MSPGLIAFGLATLLPVAILLGVLLSKKSGAPPEAPLSAIGFALIPVFAVVLLAFFAFLAEHPAVRTLLILGEIALCWNAFDWGKPNRRR